MSANSQNTSANLSQTITDTNIITARAITKVYGTKQAPIQALGPVDIQVAKGSFTVILGRSGSGKSTLLNVLTGLDKITSGELIVNNQDLSKINSSKLAKYRSGIGIIFQSYNLLPSLSTLENVLIGSWAGGNSLTRADAKKLLSEFGLEHRLNANIKTLSGGEKQRVAICRSLINKPEVLFCDEPTGALDSQNEDQVRDILINLNKNQGVTIVMVTHNDDFASIANQVIRMKDGSIV